MMTAAVVVGVGVAALAGLFAAEFRAAKQRDLTGKMESVLCSGSVCDIETAMPPA